MWQIISNFIGNIFVAIGVFLFAKIVLAKPIKVSKKELIITLILSVFSYTIIMFYLENLLKTLFMGLTMIFFNKRIFKENNKKIVLLIFVYMILLVITELLGLGLLMKIFNMSKEFCYNEFAGSILCNVIIQFLFIIIIIIFKPMLKIIINKKLETNTKIIVCSILTIISILVFFYSLIKEFRLSNDIYLYLGVIVVLISLIFSLIKQTNDNYKITNEYDKLLEFMTTYENEIENQRILRHEVKNEFRTIRAKICDNQENKEIIEYIDEIVKDKYEVNKEKYAKFGYLPPNGIKGLFYFKTQEAEKRKINVAINISKKVKYSIIYNLNIKQQRDFGRIIGVILDNAIEASTETNKKQLGIEAYVNLEAEFKLIISNTFNNKIEENKIGKERFSTKGKNRGHGLLLVKQLIEKNNIFELKTEIKEDLYIQTITVKNYNQK